MARDRQLPAFLSRVNAKHKVPVNATLAVAAVSLVLGVYMSTRGNGVGELASLVNFGAMTAFLVLHVSVVVHYVVRQRSTNWWAHLVAPVIGFVVLVAVVYNQNVAAQWVGGVWLAIGLAVLGITYLIGRKPTLPTEVS
jgi:amino acid transporter